MTTAVWILNDFITKLLEEHAPTKKYELQGNLHRG